MTEQVGSKNGYSLLSIMTFPTARQVEQKGNETPINQFRTD